MQFKGKMMISLCISVALLFGVTGCGSTHVVDDSLVAYYEGVEGVNYIETIESVDPDMVFEFEVGEALAKDLKNEKIKASELFTVYLDEALSEPLSVKVAYDKETDKVSVSPYRKEAIEDVKYEDLTVVNKEDWGIFPAYYMVQNVDLESGKSFKTKELTVFHVARDLDTPEVKASYDDNGNVVLTWDKVDHAKSYLLLKIELRDSENMKPSVIAETDKTTYTLTLESGLQAYRISEDEQYASSASYWWENGDAIHYTGARFAVVARNKEELSTLGWPEAYVASQMSCAFPSFAQEEVGYHKEYGSIAELPNAILVTACDGDTVYQLPQLSLKEVYEEENKLHVPYTFENSSLKGEFVVTTYDKDAYSKALKAQKKKMEQGYEQLETTKYTYQSDKTVAANAVHSDTTPEVSDKVFNRSEVETFIAKNMIAGTNVIDFTAYEEEIYDEDIDLYDVIEEVINQNPIIMQTLNYEVNYDENTIYVQYIYGYETRKAKQQQLRDIVKQEITQIVTPEMSTVEKIYAINDYICNQSVYDEAAGDIITTTGKMGAAYYESNTAYGIFFNHTAVCEGYATAFDLLSREAGLETIMVTGHMNSNLDVRHAWNRVNVDGQWYVVDVTTNDGDFARNSVLLLPDEIADNLYTEDEYFVLDEALNDYTATGSQYEYYRYYGLFVNQAEATTRFASMLQSNNQATLKLDELTSDAVFDQIAESVVNTIDRSIHYVWLHGVLTIEAN